MVRIPVGAPAAPGRRGTLRRIAGLAGLVTALTLTLAGTSAPPPGLLGDPGGRTLPSRVPVTLGSLDDGLLGDGLLGDGLLGDGLLGADPALAPLRAAPAAPAGTVGPELPGPSEARLQHGILLRTENWAGYVATNGTFTDVSGQWRVPTAHCGQADSFNAQWVGIDGYGGSTVQQAGTTVYCHAGAPSYYAWYEMFGTAAVNHGFAVPLPAADAVRAGDRVSAAVHGAHGAWRLRLQNMTLGWTFETTVHADARQASAEWIVERPSVCSTTAHCVVSDLSPATAVSFTAAQARADSGTKPLAGLHTSALEMVDEASGRVLARPSAVTGRTSFTVASPAGDDAEARRAGTHGCRARPFTDVAASDPFCTAIGWLKTSGITTGYANGTFHPRAAVSRAAMAAFLYRVADNGRGAAPACSDKPFTDVAVRAPFCGEIAWMGKNGVSTGYADGSFHPGAAISRGAMAVFLYRMQHDGDGVPPACTARPFTDVAVADPSCGAVAWLKAEGITTGYADGSFHPAAHISRGAMAAFLYRLSTLPAAGAGAGAGGGAAVRRSGLSIG